MKEIDGLCVKEPWWVRVLSIHAYTDKKYNTPKMCVQACSYPGYKYAGVWDADECWCGNDDPPRDKYTLPTKCDMPCTGDNTTMCGAKNLLNLYKTSKTFFREYIAVLQSLQSP